MQTTIDQNPCVVERFGGMWIAHHHALDTFKGWKPYSLDLSPEVSLACGLLCVTILADIRGCFLVFLTLWLLYVAVRF